jgi:hypothetical protein
MSTTRDKAHYQELARKSHAARRERGGRPKTAPDTVTLTCEWCKKEFERSYAQWRNDNKWGKRTSLCGRPCVRARNLARGVSGW